jgi:hypothetical protein
MRSGGRVRPRRRGRGRDRRPGDGDRRSRRAPGGLPAGQAALLNGTLCHLLDFDDTHPDSVVHVSAAVLEGLRSLNALGVLAGARTPADALV